MVPVLDTTAVAGALKQMIESAELRRQLGTRGRALVEREFTLAKVIAETLKVYEGLIQ